MEGMEGMEGWMDVSETLLVLSEILYLFLQRDRMKGKERGRRDEGSRGKEWGKR